jgi:hypothetical protein
LVEPDPDTLQAHFRDTRAFVIEGLSDLWELLNSDVVIARAELVKHVKEIWLYPEGNNYRACGTWDYLGSGRMVQLRPAAPFFEQRPTTAIPRIDFSVFSPQFASAQPVIIPAIQPAAQAENRSKEIETTTSRRAGTHGKSFWLCGKERDSGSNVFSGGVIGGSGTRGR